MLGLNRTTVSAAYELLEQEGLIKGHVGRGSFVAGTEPPLDWGRLLRSSSHEGGQPPLRAGFPRISFASSRPAGELFPLDAFRESCHDVLQGADLRSILQLGSPYGYEPLRAYLLDEARRESLVGVNEEIVVTNGCQQAIDLLARVMVEPGDGVLLEDPVYPGLQQVFSRAGARVTGIPAGEDGLQIDVLERVLDLQRPKLLVVTPTYQNPTGATMPLAARLSLLRMTQERGVVVVENDMYSRLSYHQPAPDCLKRHDPVGNVILIRSFSKVAFPGLRVGWVLAPRPLAARLAEAKQWADLHSDQLSQAILLRFAESGRLQQHMRAVIEAGAERLAATAEACREYLPAGSTFTRPQGGMNLWVRLPETLDAGELLPRVQRHGVDYLPGRYFAVSRSFHNCLRLSFAGLEPRAIRQGLETIGGVFAEELERVRELAGASPAPAMV